MFTIGTAGHIDHGKTTLCKLLTGVDTDRLVEEKERGISIDLGFANLVTPQGKVVGIVDVPGHERFIRNMVAGVSGIEAFLFTIAADEGIMPQTREHFDILRILGVSRGIVVLTKCDLVDRDWIDMVRGDVVDYLKGTPFASLPILEVDQDRPDSIRALVAQIDRMLTFERVSDTASLFRMPIDRAFSLKGHGTVVTGTVLSGRLTVGEQVEILPAGLRSRVRSIQSYHHPEQSVIAGQRGALNLADVEAAQVERGHTAATPGAFSLSSMLDARLTLLSKLPAPFPKLKSASRIRFYVGTTEVIGRLHLLETQEMDPGADQMVQIRLERPVVVNRQDRFLIRTFSPVFTVGGGVVLEPHPPKRRRDPTVARQLAQSEGSRPADLIVSCLRRAQMPLVTAAEVAQTLVLRIDTVEAELKGLSSTIGSVDRRKRRYYFLKDRLSREGQRIRELVVKHHHEQPLTLGIDRASLQVLFDPRCESEAFADLLSLIAAECGLVIEGSLVRDSHFAPSLDPETEIQFANIERQLINDGFVTATELFGSTRMRRNAFDKLLGLMLAQKVIFKLPSNLLAHRRTIFDYERQIVEFLTIRDKASVGEIKELLNLTRKSLIPLLEFFDEKGVTVRAGNERRLRHRPTGPSGLSGG